MKYNQRRRGGIAHVLMKLMNGSEMQWQEAVNWKVSGMHLTTTRQYNAQVVNATVSVTNIHTHHNLAQVALIARRIQPLTLLLQLLMMLIVQHHSRLLLGRTALHEVLITITLVFNCSHQLVYWLN